MSVQAPIDPSAAPVLMNVPRSGMIVPEMGTRSNRGLADALFTRGQQRVLGLLFGQPERRFQSAEIIRLAASGTGAVHRQLARLEAAGLLSVQRTGNQKHYQANAQSPIFAELHGIVLKTVAVVEPLRKALAALRPSIRAAFVYGSVSKQTDKAGSDIDVLIVSDRLQYADVYTALQRAEASLGRSVNPTVLSVADWRAKRSRKGSFVSRIADQPKLFLIGTDDDLG